jgi:hypothetical protein
MCGMSRHAQTEPIGDHRRLIATVTPRCFSQMLVLANGWPRLVIDHGEAALLLDVADLWQAEAFAFDLARASLEFAASCRDLMGRTP